MRLLVSVIDVEEVQAARAGGAEIIDIKNPAEGALGAAEPRVILAIRGALPKGVSLSATLGDAPHLPGTVALAGRGAALCGADYVKVGLRGSRTAAEALTLLRTLGEAVREARPDSRVVACAYADAREVGAFPPEDLPPVAAAAGIAGCMIDTLIKDGRGLFDHLPVEAVAAFVAAARGRGLLTALAGSLGLRDLPQVAACGPDIVGFRGAACIGGRGGRLVPERVRAIRVALDDQAAVRPAVPQ